MTETWAFLLERPEIQFDQELLARAFTGRRIVITGAAGSVGTALSCLARQYSPEELVLVDNHEASLVRLASSFDAADGTTPSRFVLADVRDRRKITQVFRQHHADVLFHLAAYKHVSSGETNVDQVLDVNVVGTMNVVECAVDAGVATVVYPSTDKSVIPSSLYGASKRIVEQYLRALTTGEPRLQVRVVRLVNVFGTQGSVIENFARWIDENQPLKVTDPAMDRYWITMSEATHLLAAASVRVKFEGIHLLDVGDPIPLVRTASTLFKRLRPGVAETAARIIGLRPGERLHEYLTYPDEQLCPTEVPGLNVIRLSAPVVPATEWLAELGILRERMFDVEPALLRAWAFDVAGGSVPWRSRAALRPTPPPTES